MNYSVKLIKTIILEVELQIEANSFVEAMEKAEDQVKENDLVLSKQTNIAVKSVVDLRKA